MKTKSGRARTIRKTAAEVRPSSAAELRSLAAQADKPVDTSDIAERRGPTERIVRDAEGRIVSPDRSPIRAAIRAEMRRSTLSGHELWKQARHHCDTIPESAVYEFLAGKRQLGLAYLDALLEALGLTVARKRSTHLRERPLETRRGEPSHRGA